MYMNGSTLNFQCWFILFALTFQLNQCTFASSQQGFVDVTAETGIDFQHTDGSSGNYYIAETVTAGLGLFDYDNDGDLDIYFVNGAALPGAEYDEKPVNRLYRNEGNFHFVNVTREAGIGDTGYGLACAMADVENDGDIDVYISNFAEDAFYRNNGDQTFTEETQKAGLGDPRVGAGVSFGDFNADGFVDLFVANYLKCPLDDPQTCDILGVRVYCDPSTFEDVYKPLPSSFYLNQGDGAFQDTSETSGIDAQEGRGMGIASTDFDNDGDLDIYVANDVNENFLYVNNGNAVFEEEALFNGVAFDYNGREQGSMGCDFGDANNDGLFDIVVTSYQNQIVTLYQNEGDSLFSDVSISSGISANSQNMVNWACFFFDYDNDGDQDVFIANGHLQDRIEEVQPAISYKQKNFLMQNQGDGTFMNVSEEAGPGLQVAESTRGGAYGDLDNDGRLDIVLSNSRTHPTILRNQFENNNHWINIKLQGNDSNYDAIGARVTVITGEKTQIQEVRAGGSYQSQYDTRLHFGLGQAVTIDHVTVRWPTGKEQTFENLKPNRFILIEEGKQEIQKQKLSK